MKIVCLGDSVTYGYRLKRSEVWTSLLEKKLKVEVVNKGISGDTSAGMLSRVYRDVILENPTYSIIMGGTNDFVWKLPVQQVMANITSIIFQIMYNNIIPIIGLPIPICTETAKKNWGNITDFDNMNFDIKELSYYLKKFSLNYNIRILDFFSLFLKKNGGGDKKYYMDGVHLNPEGNRKMTDIIFILNQSEL
ncbi:GDSL-type esterase/lipase family protein [Clostridium sp. LBM24168]